MTYISQTEFFFEVTKGNVPGHSIGAKFGRNPDIDTTSTPEDIFNGGGVYAGMPDHADAAETVDVYSDDAADTSAGTGARTVRIQGLDENWDEQSADVTLNGTTPVATTEQWKRVNRMFVLTGGSGGANAGTITVEHSTTSANVFCVMPPGQNQTTIAAYTVPRNKTGYIVRIKNQIGRTSGAAGSADYSLKIREEGGVFRDVRYETITTSFADSYTLQGGIVAPGKSDIKVTCESVSDNNTAFSAVFEYVLVDD